MGPLQGNDDALYVSTGHLRSPEQVWRSVDEAYARHRMVAEAAVCHFILAVMTTAGMYEASGDWLYDVGVPGA